MLGVRHVITDFNLPLLPDRAAFERLAAAGHNLIPVFTELAADYETPLSVYQKLAEPGSASFLFESAEMTSDSGRYSLLGGRPAALLQAHGSRMTRIDHQGRHEWDTETEPLAELENWMADYRPAKIEGLPVFHGGAVGFLAYDMVRFFEPSLPPPPPDSLGLPDLAFFITDTVVIFDHRFRKMQLVASADLRRFETTEAAWLDAVERLRKLVGRLEAPQPHRSLEAFSPQPARPAPDAASNTSQEEYEDMVRRAKEFIASGDIFQVVPSQRFGMPYEGSPLDLYRALRHVNPSPYMFCLRFPEGFSLVGSSPEVHVRCIDGTIEIRPIAGTRWRGTSEEEDDELARDLLADQKERAEHIMLVDLARNDVGRIAEFGSVEVDDLMIIERYSHVMHIVSNVRGRLRPGCSSYDVMRATFPAGTVSGSPKVRAMEIINELEKNKRGAYSGAVGYFGFDGALDSCIALRTCVLKDGMAYVQAGAGVVADSDPAYEYNETVNKAAAMLRAIRRAGELSGRSRGADD